jgi:hypothetical protein
MPRTRIVGFAFFTLIVSLACATLLGSPATNQELPLTEAPITTGVPIVTESPVTDEPVASCPVITDQIVEMNSPELVQGESDTMDFGDRAADTETYLITYVVSGNNILDPYLENVPSDLQDEQNDTAAHERIWGYFAELIPLDYRSDLSEFSVMTDGQDNILAAVAQTYDDPAKWGLEVDIADTQDYYYLTFTLVHEFAHLLTLGPSQVPPSEAIFNNPDDEALYNQELAACPNYFPGEGCSNSDSYINAFYTQFWADIYDEWNTINLEEDEDVYYQKLDDFYYKYQDQFLTDYSVTHPAEDIAEAFAFFVFSEKPAGDTIAEQKILFFYNYPELVQLRGYILQNTCASFPQ